jgi:prolipoprotein diacylglyceryl transferase
MIASGVLASIPSPSSGTLHIGPLSIHAYGLMIALGVVAAVWLLGKRLVVYGAGTPDDASAVAVWGVTAGVIGARLYHVATDWSAFSGHPERIIQIWKGGLGVPGGLLAGIVVGLWAGTKRGIPASVLANCAAPALPLAQAIGRLGNWFNQELFGRPTTLPWALKVSDANTTAAGYSPGTTFHPTFLYEIVWNLLLCVVLLRIDRQWRPRPPRLMAMYLLGYFVGRFWIEGLRIDPAHHLGGLRWNQWVALVVAVASATYLIIDARQQRAVVDGTEPDDDFDDDDELDDGLDDLDLDDEAEPVRVDGGDGVSVDDEFKEDVDLDDQR